MAERKIFQWHPAAQLFAGARCIARPPVAAHGGFRALSATSTVAALEDLANVLGTGAGFCLHHLAWDAAVGADRGKFLTLTGGSSGQPKIIRRSQASWVRGFDINARLFELTLQDSVAVFGNLSHSLALYGVLEALHLGLDAYALDLCSASQQRACITSNDIRILYATPVQLRLLAGQHATDPMPSVRLILCGGGQLDAVSRGAIQRVFPRADLRVFYGAAETSFISLADADTPPGSVGKPYPGVDLDLRPVSDGPPGKDREVWVRSPYLFDAYANRTDSEARWDGGFLTVGELGHLDSDGNLWLTGRRSRLVKIADQNVSPEQVEALISSRPDVAECAVLPRPDPLRGHHLVAIVQGPGDDRMAQEIRDMCRRALGPLQTPRQVVFLERLPLLRSGKVDLRALEAGL